MICHGLFDYLPNGKVMFAGNQTTLDLRDPLNSDLGLSSQLIMSLDDVGFNSNQSECAGFFSLDPQSTGDVTLDIVLINTVLFAVSVRANDNRFTDGLTLTLYSLMSYGYMNTAIGNQATHCMIVLGNMVNKWNLILISNLCKDDNEVFRTTLGAPVAKEGTSKYGLLGLKSKPCNEKNNFSTKDVANKVDDSITQVDQLRVSGLTSLKQVQQKRLNILKFERDRLSQKNSDDPRIAGFDEQLSYGDQLSSAIDFEIAKSSAAHTPLPIDAWRMQGNVYYQDNTPASGVTVFFADGNKQWIEALGNSCTDATGYYSITADGKLITDATTKLQLYLSAQDNKKQLSYMDSQPSVPAKGLIDTKNIYLGVTGKDCPPPVKDKPRSKPESK